MENHLTAELEKRYWETVERPQDEKASLTSEIVEFRLADETYGINTISAKGITRFPKIVKIPGASDIFLGAMRFRGRVVPVTDFRKVMGLATSPWKDEARVIVVGTESDPFAMAVDEVLGVTEINVNDIQPPPASFAGARREVIRGQIKQEDRLIILVDMGAVIEFLCGGSEEVLGERS